MCRGAHAWSPDGKWIVTGGNVANGAGLFKIPLDGGQPVSILAGLALNPVWSPDGTLIVYVGANVGNETPLLAVRPDGGRVELPAIGIYSNGERVRFMPDGKGLVYMQGRNPWQDFWLLDLTTKKTRPLTRLAGRPRCGRSTSPLTAGKSSSIGCARIPTSSSSSGRADRLFEGADRLS